MQRERFPTAAIATALYDAVPQELQDAVPSMVQALADATSGAIDREVLQKRLSGNPALVRILQLLAGKEIEGNGTIISFGSGNQLGNVTIGDVAGHDIVNVSLHQVIIAVEQAYHVYGLPNPYLGLHPFTYTDRDRFAGRTCAIEVARDLLTEPGEERSLLFVTGASGCGKSSFVQAGLLPALDKYYQEHQIRIHSTILRPGREPMVAMATALHMLGLHPKQGRSSSANSVNIIVVDQFEEVFTQSLPEQATRFIKTLTSFPSFTRAHTHVLITMRSDYLPDLFQHKALYDVAKQGLDLRVMSPEELADAILCPIQVAAPEKRIEPALLDRLVADASGDASYLPLLQVTLESLWRRGELRLGMYTSLTDAFRQRADTVLYYNDFDGMQQERRSDADQTQILDLFLDLIEVLPSGDGHRDIRRRRRLDDLTRADPHRLELVNSLISARLLAAGIEQHGTIEVQTVDIIHESLIANWDRLHNTVTQCREALQRRRRFEEALAEWLAHGKAEVFLLDGGRLAEAQLLAESDDVSLRDGDGQDLFQRSLARRDIQRRRQLRRAWMIALTLATLLVVAVSAAGWAAHQTQVAQDQLLVVQTAQAETKAQFLRSEAQRLAFAAQEEFVRAPETALLLAYEAVALNADTVTIQNLRAALLLPTVTELVLRGHTKEITKAEFSPDGTKIVTASADKTAIIWDSQAGEQLFTLTGHTDTVTDAAFSPDGTKVVTSSADKTAIIWDIQTGKPLRTLKGHTGGVVSTDFAPDGQLLVTASDDTTAIIWDVQTGQQLLVLHEPGNEFSSPFPFASVAFSYDGRHILTTSANTSILWDAVSGEIIETRYHSTGPVYQAAFSPSDDSYAVASFNNMTYVWGTAGTSKGVTLENAIHLSGHTSDVIGVAFAPDGKRLVTASKDGTAIVWDTATWNAITTLKGHSDAVRSAMFSPDGSRIVTASDDRTANVWNVQSNSSLNDIPVRTDSISTYYTAALNPDGTRIATDDSEGAIIWDPRSGTPDLILHGEGWAHELDYSPDGTHLAAALDMGNGMTSAVIWDTADGRTLLTLRCPMSSVQNVRYSRDGNYIALACSNGTTQIWDTRSNVLVSTLDGHRGWVADIDFSPDGKHVVTVSEDKTGKIWDLASSNALLTLQGHTDIVNSVAYSPDGTRIATASRDKTTIIWDALTGQRLITLTGHNNWILSVAYSPDGKQIVTSSADNTAIVWDVENGQRQAILSGHTDQVRSALFSPDQKVILTASIDRSIRLHPLVADDLLAIAACKIRRALNDDEIQRFGVSLPTHFSPDTRVCPPKLIWSLGRS